MAYSRANRPNATQKQVDTWVKILGEKSPYLKAYDRNKVKKATAKNKKSSGRSGV